MTKKHIRIDFKKIKEFLPYIVTGVVTLGIVFVGSLDKQKPTATVSLDSFADSDNSMY
ncbi:hypothetical protein IKD82_00090 [Candidatus Saccharibacteria bacterium]|nr:hypothetical protein [Candidatus Saccharibacteria bacterium]